MAACMNASTSLCGTPASSMAAAILPTMLIAVASLPTGLTVTFGYFGAMPAPVAARFIARPHPQFGSLPGHPPLVGRHRSRQLCQALEAARHGTGYRAI